MRRRKETEKAAVERRKRMYGCEGECVKEIYDTETQKRSMPSYKLGWNKCLDAIEGDADKTDD